MTRRLEQLAEAVREASGIMMGRRQLGSLRSALSRALPGVEPERVLDAFEDRAGEPGLLERIVDEVTVKESFFMREAAQLGSLSWPQLLSSARARGSDRVRVWSAACAGGEEPYTLAILASDALGSQRPPVEILATDISVSALAHARRGNFGRRAIRTLDPAVLERHFHIHAREASVRQPLRELVSFRRHNLARDAGPPAGEEGFDLVVCRNVLIYFEAPAVRHALSVLEQALQPDGILLLGAADRLCVPRGRERAPRQPVAAPGRPGSGRRSGSSAAPRSVRQRGRAPRPRPSGRLIASPPGGDPRRAEQRAAHARIEDTAAAANEALAEDPLSGEAYFLRATVELSMGDSGAAIASLRAALYARPEFAVAAFQLGRAYEVAGDERAARRAYEQALRTLDRDDRRHAELLGDVDIGDIAYACGVRIRALAQE